MVVDDRLFVQLPLAISSVPVRQTGGEHWASEFLFFPGFPKGLASGRLPGQTGIRSGGGVVAHYDVITTLAVIFRH